MFITQERFSLATSNIDICLRTLICMFVPNIEALSLVTMVLGPKNRPQVWRKKAVSIKNGLSTAKNILRGYGRDEAFFSFFLFFSS